MKLKNAPALSRLLIQGSSISRRQRIVAAVICAVVSFLTAQCSYALLTADPDAFPAGTDISNAFPGVTLSTRDGLAPGTNSRVVTSATDPFATTGTRAFAHDGGDTAWGDGTFEFLRADFAGGASFVSLDFFANDSGGDHNAQLLAFDSSNNQLATSSAPFVAANTFATLTVSAPNIAYIAAYWDETTELESGGLDNLRYELVPEPSAILVAGLGAGMLAINCRRRKSGITYRA